MFEGLERDGAEVEGQPLEVCACLGGFARICASGGGEGIFAAPLAVGDLKRYVSMVEVV
jgi:hypothetical protein